MTGTTTIPKCLLRKNIKIVKIRFKINKKHQFFMPQTSVDTSCFYSGSIQSQGNWTSTRKNSIRDY